MIPKPACTAPLFLAASTMWQIWPGHPYLPWVKETFLNPLQLDAREESLAGPCGGLRGKKIGPGGETVYGEK